jgi:hypothetical protein
VLILSRTAVGLAKTTHIYGVYTFFGRETTKYTVIYTVLANPANAKEGGGVMIQCAG